MVEQAKWTSLTFTFDFPVGKFPALVERLRGASPRLEYFVKNTPKELLTKTQGEAWSIQEHIGHLIDLDELLDTRLAEFENNAEVLSAADMSNKKTYAANYNDADIETLVRDFDAIRMKQTERMENYDEEMLNRIALHPRLNQPMRVVDLAYFFAEHDDHHIAIMRKLLKYFTA